MLATLIRNLGMQNMPGQKTSNETIDVLYVEDDADTAATMKRVLSRDGFARVSIAGSVDDAVQQLGVLTPQIILVDLGLPGVSGLEGVRVLHTAAPNIPIVIFTGRLADENDDDFRAEIAQAGADGYLIKGTGNFLIRQEIRVVLSRHHRAQGEKLLRGGRD